MIYLARQCRRGRAHEQARQTHRLTTRIWHWTNLVAVVILFMSGLTISNAHRYLYWGEWGSGEGWLTVPRFPDWMTIPGYYSRRWRATGVSLPLCVRTDALFGWTRCW